MGESREDTSPPSPFPSPPSQLQWLLRILDVLGILNQHIPIAVLPDSVHLILILQRTVRQAKRFHLSSLWDNRAGSLQLQGREPSSWGHFLGSGAMAKRLGKEHKAQPLEGTGVGCEGRNPFKEDAVCHPGKGTTVERGKRQGIGHAEGGSG